MQLQTNTHPRHLSDTLAEVHVPIYEPEDNTIKTLDFKRALVMSLEDQVKVVMEIGTGNVQKLVMCILNCWRSSQVLKLFTYVLCITY